MKVPALFSAGWFGRLFAQEARGLRHELARTNDLLERLVAVHAPPLSDALSPDELATATRADHVDENDAVLAAHFVQLTERTEGRTPTDDEILTYLSDEKTVELHERLLARDQEMRERVERRQGSRL